MEINNITPSTKNVHVTKSTVHTIGDSEKRAQINVLKITKTKPHTLKPRLFGYMNMIRSKYISRWKMTQEPRVIFLFWMDYRHRQILMRKNQILLKIEKLKMYNIYSLN